MLGQVGQVRPGYDRLGQFRQCKVKLVHVIRRLEILSQIITG
jgi:hypothetical protein